jgi:hypothetical protein
VNERGRTRRTNDERPTTKALPGEDLEEARGTEWSLGESNP